MLVNLKGILKVATVSGLVLGGAWGIHSYTSAEHKTAATVTKADGTTSTAKAVKGVSSYDLKQLSSGMDEKMEWKGQARKKWLERIAKYLGEQPEAVEKSIGHHPPREAAMAAVIAKLSGQELDVVLKAKENRTWKEVAAQYKVNRREIRKEIRRILPRDARAFHFLKRHPGFAVQELSDYLGMEPKELVGLARKEKTNLAGLVKASILSKASGKSLEEVFAHKTRDNTWSEVGKSLGVDRSELRKAAKELLTRFRKDWKETTGWLKEIRRQGKEQEKDSSFAPQKAPKEREDSTSRL
ncbi:hypothetical protein GCM10011571_06380 [Marinithermofilum abyssi]|uniref:Uncharacterized protein n=1 Tax=Marinithermofilum abyssi TaxID=1571185 RepID=A0A8J2VHH0_9BACL|nr:hypothetical protein [Marinithermofilum abyssi]GGE07852.1 hypothetical protein GCM10011571_06380 [Marinithermofilum abyssi]